MSGSRPRIAEKNNRGSYAAYVDLETNVTKDLLVGAAGRYEDFETFGDTLNGKAKCPLASHVRHGASRFDQHGLPCPDRGTSEHSERDHGDRKLGNSKRTQFPGTRSGAGIVEGAKPLTPEKAFNLSAGTVANFGNLSVTVDYYRIKVRDRIAITETSKGVDAVRARLLEQVSRCPDIAS